MSERDNDKELLTRLITGDQAAFTTLYDRYAGRTCNYFSSYIKRRDIAEELTQDIFTKIWTIRSSLKPGVPFEGFLFLMARNHAFNFLKRKLKEQAITAGLGLPEVDTEDPFVVQSYKETLREYRDCLGQLGESQRNIFLLNREQGLTYRQIAERTGISVKTVEWHISNALRILRNSIGPFYLAMIISLLQN